MTSRLAGTRQTQRRSLDRPFRHLPQAAAAVARTGQALPRPALPDDRLNKTHARRLRHRAGAASRQPDHRRAGPASARYGTTTAAPACSSAHPRTRVFRTPFLQCAAAGVPVASLPLIPRGSCRATAVGCSPAASVDELERDVRSLWADAELAESHALTFHRYALAHHGLRPPGRALRVPAQEGHRCTLANPTTALVASSSSPLPRRTRGLICAASLESFERRCRGSPPSP